MAPYYLGSHFHRSLHALKHNFAAVVADAVAAGDVVGDGTCSDDWVMNHLVLS